ncbi:hypothetical protein FQA39_LY08607 [Lamprigera yunnana]|nr:hypothetical protein FQA39_LY08607 [Lamprigera yunnana]
MAPYYSRRLLVWTTLPIAIILSYLWFKRKRTEITSDPGQLKLLETQETVAFQDIKAVKTTPENPIKTLSGIESSPIDIVFPPDLKPSKSVPPIISDEDLDLEIEKIKSTKNNVKSSSEKFNKNKETSKIELSIEKVDCVKEEFIPKNMLMSPTKIQNTNKIVESTKNVLMSSNEIQAMPSKQLISGKKSAPSERLVLIKKLTLDKQTMPSKKLTPMKQSIPSKQIKVLSKNEKSILDKKDVVSGNLEKAMSSLKMETTSPNRQKLLKGIPAVSTTEQEILKQNIERDSANHSPADIMLASPSLSYISDSHSEGSNDSGKGCSEVATPPLRTSADDAFMSRDSTIYQFIIPQDLVGRLIGRYGTFVTQIKNRTRANIVIEKYPDDNNSKICIVEGAQTEIDSALKMIRDKFPKKRYPYLTLEQVEFTPTEPRVFLNPEYLCLKLVEGINNDTIVSCMVAPNHLFLQQPTHPSFPNLDMLACLMNSCYSDINSPPMLPHRLPDSTVCAAYCLDAWYRVLVLSTDEETETSCVVFIDYGGFANINNSDLRQLRADFLMLPFQACECFLANIRPLEGEDAEWAPEAYTMVADLTKGNIVSTQVAEYTTDGIPLVLIYVIVSSQEVLLLNNELVNRGFAEWISGTKKYVVEQATSNNA